MSDFIDQELEAFPIPEDAPVMITTLFFTS